MSTDTRRWGRWGGAVAAVAVAVAAAVPLAMTGAAPAAASQQGDDHKITLCHQTDAENNPYVVITIDKAGVFQQGHDGHDEGGVYQAGDKANGIRWGDIIPAFDYYASPQDEAAGTVSHYGGLNDTAEGLDVLANGCQVPSPPVEQPQPTGIVAGSCTDGDFVATGATDSDGANDATFRLSIAGGGTIPVSGTFTQTVAAAAGTVVTLEYRLGSGDWTSTGQTVTVKDCSTTPPPQATPPTGSFTVSCTATGGSVDVGELNPGGGTGGQFDLVVNGSAMAVHSGENGIAVPAQASLVLRYVASDSSTTTLDSGTAPAACPTPPGGTEQRGLTVTKSVSPTGPAAIGATLTYSLAVSTAGNAAQTAVTVTDYLPGYRPGATSGTTTYVAGSATCSGGGTCTTSYDLASHQVTWGLGTLPAGTTRTVSFQVTIDRPAGAGETIPAFDVANTGVAGSTQVSPVTSNEVVTPVAAVEAVKTGTSGGSGSPGSSPSGSSGTPDTGVLGTKTGNLPHTGAGDIGPLLGVAGLLLLVGTALVAMPKVAVRRPRRIR
jgi:uncharacterized repeat protein (TIGR01451 family)